MKKRTFATLSLDGKILDISEDASRMCGIPLNGLRGHQLSSHMVAEHRVRFNCEMEALAKSEEDHGRVHCTVIGADAIGRRLTIVLTREDDNRIVAKLSRYEHPESFPQATGSLLLEAARLLPVARRISAIARRARRKEQLLSAGLEVLAEVTQARSGTALDWRRPDTEQPNIQVGEFDPDHLRGVFRASVLARLTRGDVVVKESTTAVDENACLLILPLLSSAAPVGIIILVLDGYTVLVPEEQQSLIILGEILGLGLKALESNTNAIPRAGLRRGDIEATVALGRLSTGLTHEIINAATILRNNVEQYVISNEGFGHQLVSDSARKDSLNALDTVTDLAEAMRAFAPEESQQLEVVDILRVIDMVSRGMRFFAKRGIRVTLERPDDTIPLVTARSHHLIRSLFLILVELVEASFDSSIDLDVHLTLATTEDHVTLSITVTAGPFSLPQVLLAQLEKGGALARQVAEAGGELIHSLDHQGNMTIGLVIPVASAAPRSSTNVPTVSAPPRRRATLLICDEDAAVIRSLRRLLERDHDILAARTSDEVLTIMRSEQDIDLLIYDASLPRMTAPEFYGLLNRTHPAMTKRVIFASGGAHEVEVADFLRTGKVNVVEKPFDLQMLNEMISAMII
jgi:CheY-like chemotaxis protein